MLFADITLSSDTIIALCTVATVGAGLLTKSWRAIVREYRERNAALEAEVSRLVHMLLNKGVEPRRRRPPGETPPPVNPRRG